MKRETRPLRDIVDHRGAGSDRGRLIVWLLLSCGHSVVRQDRMIPYPRYGATDGNGNLIHEERPVRARCDHCALGCPPDIGHDCPYA